MLDYAALRVIWWLLLGAILIGFAVTDGFDLGVAALFRWLGRDDDERRAVLESIEPVWDGNQVWLILGGGAVFAAWPLLYAASFSGLYFAMLLVLLALILRPVAFFFRNKLEHARWRLPPPHTSWAIAYNAVGVFGFAHAAWFYLARRMPPVASSISVMLIPVLGTFSGAAWLGEPLHWQDFAAMVLMVVAIAAVLIGAPARADTGR